MRVLAPVRAEGYAHKRAAAVSYHNGYRKGYDRQREHDSVCGVAVRAEICGVRDEYLVDNVIERRDEQGNHAGYRIFAHEPAELFLPEKGLIVIFMVVSFAKNKRRKPIRIYAFGYTMKKLYQLLPYFSKAVIVKLLFFASMILYKKRRDA